MKFTRNTLSIVAFVIVVGASAQDVNTDGSKEMGFKKMVDEKSFVFVAQSASPMKGGLRTLSPEYTLMVLSDSVICHLPYFGRSFNAPMNPSDAGIEFTSTDFQYSVKNGKKGGWEITLIPNDVRKFSKVYISISAKGNSSVRVQCTDRDPISFNGYIEERKIR